MAWNPPSLDQQNRKLRRDVGVIRNLTFVASPSLGGSQSGTGAGSRDTNQGGAQGMQSFSLQTHVAIPVDVALKLGIILYSATPVVDYASSPIDLWYINPALLNGAFQFQTKAGTLITIRPQVGKTLILKDATDLTGTNGNFYLDGDITLHENDIIVLQWMPDLGSKGMWVASTPAVAGTTTNWSDININVDKDMLGHGLFNLSYVRLAGDNPSRYTEYKMNAFYDVVNLIDALHTNIGHTWQINGANYFEIVHNTAATPHTDFLFAGAHFNMNNFDLYNVDAVQFVFTDGKVRSIAGFIGVGLVYNVPTGEYHKFVEGSTELFRIKDSELLFYWDGVNKVADLSKGLFGQGELALYGTVNSDGKLKVVNLTSTTNGNTVGEVTFDGKTLASAQFSVAQLIGYQINTDDNHKTGRLEFWAWNDNVNTDIMAIDGSPLNFGLDMVNHDILKVKNLKFGSVGAIDTTVAMITNDGAKNLILSVPSTKAIQFWINNTEFGSIVSTGLGGELIIQGASGANWSLTKANATPAIYASSDGHQFNNGVFPGSLGISLGLSATYWQSIYGREFRLIPGVAGALDTSRPMITTSITSDMILGVPTGDLFRFYFNGVDTWDLSSSSLQGPSIILSNSLTLNNAGVDPSINGEFTRNVNDVKVFTGGVVKNLTQMPQLNGANIFTSTNSFVAGLSTPVQRFIILNNNDSGDTGFEQSTGVGVRPELLNITCFADIVFQGVGENTSALSRGLIKGFSQAGAPTTAQIPAGYMAVEKNTSNGQVRLYYNDAGTLKSVLLA